MIENCHIFDVLRLLLYCCIAFTIHSIGLWDDSKSKPYDVSLFRVAVGKEKLNYDAIENENEQKFEIDRISYDPGYNHATENYAADIVLIVLKTTIDFKSYITPICIPYGLTFDRIISDQI